jgi:hypothetical protein
MPSSSGPDQESMKIRKASKNKLFCCFLAKTSKKACFYLLFQLFIDFPNYATQLWDSLGNHEKAGKASKHKLFCWFSLENIRKACFYWVF